MAKPGGGPKPPALKLLTGRKPGCDAAGRPVPRVGFDTGKAPEPPDWLHPEARAEWDRVTPTLVTLDVTKPEDRATLAAYCQAVATYVRATKQLNRQGLTIKTIVGLPDGTTQEKPMVNPLWRVVRESGAELLRFAKEFGLTPAAEGAVAKVRINREDATNPFAGPTAQTGTTP